MTNELGDGKLVWVSLGGGVGGGTKSASQWFFFPTFRLFVVPSLNTAPLIMRTCGGITHVKEANLINFLFYVLCGLQPCTWLWKDARESLENMFSVKRNKTNGANVSSYVPTRVSISVHVAKNINVQRYGD